jgi:enamine deaminase RidA (YjgF/YER057c/UK114 family)
MIERISATPILRRVVKHNGTIYLAGVAAKDLSADMAGQTTETLERIGELLAANGSSKDRVLSATVFMTDLAKKEEMNRAWVAFFGAANLPTRATIGINDLGANILVEIVATAAPV